MRGQYLPGFDAQIILADAMPVSVRAFVTFTPDGGYVIVVNSRLSGSAQKEAVLHELRHIAGGQIYSVLSVTTLEHEISD